MKTHPAENAFGEAVVLAVGDDGVHHLPAHHAVVPRAVHDFRVREMIDEFVEKPRKKRADPRLPLPRSPAGGHTVKVARRRMKNVPHGRQERRRILQIHIHGHDPLSLCHLQPGVQRCLFAEISREGNIVYRAAGNFLQLTQNRQGPIGTPVIHEAVFDFRSNLALHLFYGLVENRYRRFLIVARHYNR